MMFAGRSTQACMPNRCTNAETSASAPSFDAPYIDTGCSGPCVSGMNLQPRSP